MHKNALNAWLNHHCLKFGWFNVFWNTVFFTALFNKLDTTWRLDKHANSLIVLQQIEALVFCRLEDLIFYPWPP